MQTLRCFGAGLFNPGAALGLFWAVWFIRNDHRYHPAETRKSLYRTISSALRKNELTYPIQKRINLLPLIQTGNRTVLPVNRTDIR